MLKNLLIFFMMAQFFLSSGIANSGTKMKVKKALLQAPQVLPLSKNYLNVKFIDPYIRIARKGHNTAAFVEIKNLTDQNLQIVNAYSSIAKITELHISVEENNVQKMRPISFISVDKGETTSLQPGGLHIMLINLKKDLVSKQIVDIHITFDNGQRMIIPFTVKEIPYNCH